MGITPGTLSQLFQPFTQADSGTTLRFGGGIGVSSMEGVGNKCWFELPFQRSNEA
jgi:signal transduction histidine kinase